LKSYLSILNSRTLLTIVISVAVPYLYYFLDLHYNLDLTLVSIAIIFPLVFTIRGAFRRREKAMEHLSRFRSGLLSVSYIITLNDKLKPEEKSKGLNLLEIISNAFLDYLNGKNNDLKIVDQNINSFIAYIEDIREQVSNGVRQKIFGHLKDVNVGQENLVAIHTHRTPISLKAYCLVFIYIFPIIYTPTIINKIGDDSPQWLTYFIVILSEFILISLYNIQDQMEHPFDADGLDDIKLDTFRLKR
jgi:hypothetical protein